MTNWSTEELERIAKSDDLHISPFREDAVTYGTSTWIWSVAVDNALYVRGYSGQSSTWYQAAVRQKAGRIIAVGMTKEVTFEPAEGPINERIDAAYRAKYRDSPYLKPMISARASHASASVRCDQAPEDYKMPVRESTRERGWTMGTGIHSREDERDRLAQARGRGPNRIS